MLRYNHYFINLWQMGRPGQISLGQALTPRGLAADWTWSWASYSIMVT